VGLINKRILFVDDEPGIRATLAIILRRYGFIVSVASTVAEALEAIKEQEFDLLFSVNSARHGYSRTYARRAICLMSINGNAAEAQATAFQLNGSYDPSP